MERAEAPPELVFGLGNPGPDHAHDRHNAGFRFIDLLAERYKAPAFSGDRRAQAAATRIDIEGARVMLIKPLAWMNSSGQVVRGVLDYFKLAPSAALIVHDDLDLPPGAARLKSGGGHGGHNGLRDVIRHCGPDFQRLRLGVGHPGDKDRVTPYVLSKPTAAESKAIEEAMQDALEAFDTLYIKGMQAAMTQLHTEPPE
ncbi:MAG: aminoacyl-tRNA hydrolase [Gammaproteobacteria bacterium]|nr:aminoacyl-tRNA hydrolase [Gammaproteobacteria bacterium]